MNDKEKALQALEHCDLCSDMPNCPGCAYLREPDCMEHLKRDIIALLKAQEPPTDTSISSAIECLLHQQDADDSDMAKAIDTAVRAMRLLKAQEPVEPRIVDTSNSKLYHNDMFKNHYCGNCGEFLHVVNRKDLFCSQCGMAVKWIG